MILKDLTYVAKSVMSDLNEPNDHNMQRYKQYAVKGYRELRDRLNMRTPYTFKTVRLTMDDKYSLSWPKDYVDYVTLAICYNNTVLTLDVNESICTDITRDSCGDIKEVVDSGKSVEPTYLDALKSGWSYLSYFHNGQYNAGNFSVGDGFLGNYYKVDKDHQRFVFNSEIISKDILLTYKSDGWTDDSNAFVPENAANALIEYVHWQIVRFKNNTPRTLIEERREAWVNLARAYNRSEYHAMTLEEMLKASRSSLQQTPKR